MSKRLLVALSDVYSNNWILVIDQVTLARLGVVSTLEQSHHMYGNAITKLRQHQKHCFIDDESGELVAAYRAGASVYELAERFGCNRETVSNHLKSRGVQMRATVLGKKQLHEAERLHASGLSLARIAKQIGVSTVTVRRRLRAQRAAMIVASPTDSAVHSQS